MKKIIYLLLLTITFLSSNQTIACYNEYQALNSSGKFVNADNLGLKFYTNFDGYVLKKNLRDLTIELQKKPTIELLSDYALTLVRAGKKEDALLVFEVLAKNYPKEYTIIANLGTTYELMGNNEKALEYIKKGLKLNPKSHNGSEWIHVKLLEAKIALEKNPKLLDGRSLLQLSANQKMDKKVRLQILEQLQERFRFCAPPDEIMSALLIDLGDCYKEQLSFEYAKAIYEVASVYYESKNSLLPNRIASCRALREKYSTTYPSNEMDFPSVNKVGGVPYKQLIETNDNTNYEIDWRRYTTNAETLLSLVGLSLSGSTEEMTKEEDSEVKPIKQEPKSKTMAIILLVSPAVLLIAILVGRKVRRNKRSDQ